MSLPVVIPFRAGGKTRLPEETRVEIALAMLGDVLEAAAAFGDAAVVTDDAAAALVADELGVHVVDDPGGGQGAAVEAGLRLCYGPCLVVNADLPGLRPSDLGALAVPARAGTVGLVQARDGTTNALALPLPEVFQPLYGPGSAARFRRHAESLGLVCHDIGLSNLRADVDTLADLERPGARLGTRTQTLLRALQR